MYIYIYIWLFISAIQSLLTISASTRDARSCARRDAHRTLTLCVYIYIYIYLIFGKIASKQNEGRSNLMCKEGRSSHTYIFDFLQFWCTNHPVPNKQQLLLRRGIVLQRATSWVSSLREWIGVLQEVDLPLSSVYALPFVFVWVDLLMDLYCICLCIWVFPIHCRGSVSCQSSSINVYI